jgi:prepilin-type N-terminal cleavage/methylation domain-containing protein
MTVNRPWQRGPRRSGFTLVELMVVIAIIAVIASLAASGIMQTINGQRKANTETTIQMINKSLDQQWNAVIAQAKKEEVPADILTMAGGAGHEDRARVIWIKLRLRQEFPESFQEALNPFPIQDNQTPPNANPYLATVSLPSLYASKLAGIVPGPSPNPNESSIMLVLALKRSRSGFKVNMDNFGAAVDDSNNQGFANNLNLKEFVDGWVNPLAFFKWPINTPAGGAYIVELDGLFQGPATSKARDPLDPNGLLVDPNWNNVNNLQAVYWFEYLLHPIHTGSGATWQPAAYFTMPTVVSAGRNGQVGDEDDILSFRLRTGARGD